MSYESGPSNHHILNYSSSSSSNDSELEDASAGFDMETQNTNCQWNHIIQQQQMAQQYYLMQSQNSTNWGGAVVGHAHIDRGRQTAATLLKNDYFGENPTYGNASYDTWIWHAFFGLPGTNNDVNVLQKSTLFQALTNGTSLPINYSIKGKDYNVGYFLADGIYPKWSTLVQAIRVPKCAKERYFVQKHESYRKDVERAFGVLQARFAIIRGAARFWGKKDLHEVMSACIIMHNMIVEEERSGYLNAYIFNDSQPPTNLDYESSPVIPPVEILRDLNNTMYRNFLGRHRDLINQGEHNELRRRLVAHLWDKRSQIGDDDDDE